MQPGSIQGSEAYKLADQLYSQQAQPLYDQLLDPLKRGIEGQYGNAIDNILSSGVDGGLASLLSQAGLSRAQALGDTEKQLRTQDILRQDQMNQNRADALAKMIAQLQSQQFGATGIMGQGALNIGHQQNQQGLMRDQMLANLLQGLYADEMTRATQLGMSGKNARLGTVTNLAQSEAGQNAGMMSSLMNMGRRLPRSEIAQRVEAAAKTLGLTDCLDRRPGEISGGQRQRVALGRALVRRPQVMLLDEPFANLDAPLRRELRRELVRLHREFGLTILLVTHDQAEALALGQRVAVMNAGVMEEVGTPAKLRARPATPSVTEFLDASLV